MTPAPTTDSYSDLFIASFSRLVLLIRRQPADVSAQKSALRSGMAVLLRGPVRIEAGIEYSDVPDENTFKGRLLLRFVDSISFAPAAPASEVLALARALAADRGPIPSTSAVTVELITSPSLQADLEGSPASSPVRMDTPLPPAERHRTMAGPVQEAEYLVQALERAAREHRWMEAIHAAQALIQLTPRFPEHEQRGHLIGLRRTFSRSLMDQFIGFAMRVTEEQGRVAEILRHAGPEGIELMVDHVRQAEAIGPRRFVHDALAASPGALPLLVPLLSSSKWHEVRHAAELLGRLGLPEAIEPLRTTATHPDVRVRKTAVEALGHFDSHAVIEPLRRALADPAPVTRVSAAHALSQRNSPGLALPILVALEAEKDPAAWDALVDALAQIDSSEAVSALVSIALDKKPLFHAGRSRSQRLEIVNALLKAKTATARRGLERIAVEADGPVRRAAEVAVEELGP
jgi:hypothetical protein